MRTGKSAAAQSAAFDHHDGPAGRVCKRRIRGQQVRTPDHRQLQVDRVMRRQTVGIRCHQERADTGSLRVMSGSPSGLLEP